MKFCLNLTPDDISFKKQLNEIESKIVTLNNNKNGTNNDGNDNNSNVKSIPNVPKSNNTIKTSVSTSTNKPTPTTSQNTNNNKKTEKNSTTEKDENDKNEKESEKIRGYKLTTDGRKTTFFNNEMDEETKKLIGDIAPQKILHAEENVPQVPGGGSVWNAAGTFESVDHCKYLHLCFLHFFHSFIILVFCG